MLSREILPLSHDTIHKCCCHCMSCRNQKSSTLSFSPLKSSPHQHLHYGSFQQHFSQSITNLEDSPGLPCWTENCYTKSLLPARQKEAVWWSPKNIPWAFQGKDTPRSKAEGRWVGRNRRKIFTAMGTNCDSLELGWTYSEPVRGALLMLSVHTILKQFMHEVD